jgi:site-specific recombinase XerD
MTRITQAQLAQDIAEFLVFKRALGHSYKRREAILRSFQRYAQAHAGADETVALEAMISGWLSRCAGRKPVTVALELGVLRQLCLYRRRSDPDGFVPGREWAPLRAESHFLPYVFSREEVRALVDAAGTHHGRNLRAATLRTLLLILYCTGLRLGEAVRLQVSDVDLERGLFVVRESKGKTRLVPFRADLAQVLETYLTERANIAEASNSGPFLVRNSGHALPVGVASEKIRRLLRKLGLKPLHGRKGPRPTDLRHAFAVHRLTDWYRQGVDIHARLPWLSAYMGHDNILGTEVYLTATAELMGLASERFEARFQQSGTQR